MQIKPKIKPIKKSRLPLLALAMVLLLLGILIYFYVTKQPAHKPHGEKQMQELFAINETLQSVAVSLDNGVQYCLEDREGKLYYTGNAARPLDAEIEQAIRSDLHSIVINDTIAPKGQPTLAMRLQPPHIKITATYETQQIDFFVGAEVPLTAEYYFKTSNTEGIYAINAGFESLFYTNPNAMLQKEKAEIHKQLIESIRFSGKHNVEIIVQSLEQDRAYGIVHKEIYYPANPVVLNAMIESLHNIDLGVFIKAYEKEENYGFHGPEALHIEVKQQAGQNATGQVPAGTKQIVVGNAIDEFSVYLLYNNNVYRASSLALQSIRSVGDTLYSKNAFPLSLLDVSNLVQIQDGTNIWKIDTQVKETETEVAVYKNGKVTDLPSFQAQLKYALQEEADVFVGPTKPQGEAVRKFIITLRNKTMEIAFYTADLYNDYIAIDGNIVYKWAKQKTQNLFHTAQ